MQKICYVLFLCPLLLFTACGGGSSSSTGNSNNADTSDYRLQRSDNGAELLQSIKAVLLKRYGTVITDDTYTDGIYETTSADEGAAGSADVSTTNVQEAGVDEADRLKTDGAYLYAAAVDKPAVMIFAANEQAEKVAELNLDTENEYSPLNGLYLRDQQLIALSSPYHFGIHPMPFAASDIAYPYPQDTKAHLFMMDVSNPRQPRQTAKLSLDGELVSSRMVGTKLYLATRQTIALKGVDYPYSEEQAAVNQAKINAAQLSDFLPDYAINGGQQNELFSADDCFKTAYSTNDYALSIVSLLVVDTSVTAPVPQGQCFLGDIETLYASTSAIYLATSSADYTNNEDGQVVYSGKTNTDLHRFALTDDAVVYRGSGRVSGHLGWYQDLKPFRLSEHNDTLRIITYTGNAVSSNQSPAHLYNLQLNAGQGELEVVGQLPNSRRPAALGKPGEQVYATRFVGERGYLVTFRLTDPLYILDLSDPRDPFIAGELEIKGYSDYLHPVGENLLLGIGKDAIADNNADVDVIPLDVAALSEPVQEVARGAWHQGVKLSLIDVSNPQQPFEKQTLVLGKRGSETAVSQSHHALTTLRQGNSLRVTLPLSRHETIDERDISRSYHPALPQFYYQWTRDELLRFDIDLDSGVLTQRTSIISEQAEANQGYAHSRYGVSDRSALIGEQVYYLHADKMLNMTW
ncbi:MAG: beta-propeller domain-containing protein [Thiolinea sp.]